MSLAVPLDLGRILTETEIDVIADQYDPASVGELLSVGLVNQSPPIEPYLTGIGRVLYPEFDPRYGPNPLSAANRERCVVALLAARSRRLELAIHIYMAVANRVLPAELAHIIMTAGVYTGIDTVGSAFGVMRTTLVVLQQLAKQQAAEPNSVIGALAVALPS